jgi:RimJ/RimL family protein N-acetyltransferase
MATELANATIQLREPSRESIDALVAAVRASIPELTRWTSWCHSEYGCADAEELLRKSAAERFEDTAYDFFIFDAAGARLLGGCGLYHIDRRSQCGSIGYWVRSDATGQGFATAAARLLAQYGFAELGLVRIAIVVAVENLASQRVAVKAGALREGILRNGLMRNGKPIDAVGFSLIPSDAGSYH